ncbi:MAG: glutathione-disulfide reductase [Burkholderiaceae bacterium]
MNKQVDLFVIGAGSGGVRAARIAAGHGATVAIAEEFRFGGTCVIRGCVPKKLLVLASRLADEFDRAQAHGWSIGTPSFDWPAMRQAKEREITRLEGLYRKNLDGAGVEIHADRAEITGPNTVRLAASGETIEAKRILIATGGYPFLPDIPGSNLAISSNEVFDLPELPRNIVIEGGGYIAVEFACLLQRLGCQVTIVYRRDQVLRGFDQDMRDHITEAMREAGIEIRTHCKIVKIEGERGNLTVHYDTGKPQQAGEVMMATGRKPKIDGLGLETAGVDLDENGSIKVSRDSQTNVPSIWAVGDVTNRMALTPIAIREGHAFADTVYGKNPWVCDHDLVPTAVFTTPEIGTVGLPEHEARERYKHVQIYRSTFRPMTNVLCEKPERMMMKMIVERESDLVLGVHVCGPDAAEMAQLAGVALKMGATKAQFDSTVALHPSAAEELVTMRTPVSD